MGPPYISIYSDTFNDWNPVRKLLAHAFDFHGRFWYGYEIEGFHYIPKEGPALLVYYHGALPFDWFYILAKVYIRKKRKISSVLDRFLFLFPGFAAPIECLKADPGTVATCADILKKGHLLGIAPGGGREAFFGDESYPLMWGSRIGFAKVAMEAKVPVIPVFTENIREAYFLINLGKNWLRGVYEKTRILPFFPLFGGFPIKLKTFIGKPIEYDASLTPQELASKVAEEMKFLIKKHQKLPGNVTRSVIERFQYLFKRKMYNSKQSFVKIFIV